MTAAVGTVIREAPCLETGATILVERTGDGSWIEQEPGWATLCLNHSNVVIHLTRTDAEGWATQPSMWCEECRKIAEGLAPRIQKTDVPMVQQ